MPNFCVDCQHYWEVDENDSRFHWSVEKQRCSYVPEGVFNLVTGEPFVKNSIGVSCYDFRLSLVIIAYTSICCGAEGKFFQKRVDTPKD